MLKNFSNPVSFKLEEDNFLPWRHQALAAIKSQKLQSHLSKEKIPSRFRSLEDESAGVE